MKLANIAKAGLAAGAALLITLGGAAGAQADPPDDPVEEGHVDIVAIICHGEDDFTLQTNIGEDDPIELPQNEIGDYEFAYDVGSAAMSRVDNKWWVASGEEEDEDLIPFLGFQYFVEDEFCPASVQIDARRAPGLPNTGRAVFTANDPLAGSTSTAWGNTSKVTLGGSAPSHVHGEWAFRGPIGGGVYNIAFDVYDSANLIGTVSPVHITVS
jgi:hypothetical protein